MTGCQCNFAITGYQRSNKGTKRHRTKVVPGEISALLSAHTLAARFALMGRDHHPLSRAVVRKLAREAGLSDRRFIDVFRFAVGLKPQFFYRVQRFQCGSEILLDDPSGKPIELFQP